MKRVAISVALLSLASVVTACATPSKVLAPQPPALGAPKTLAAETGQFYTDMASAGSPSKYVSFNYGRSFQACSTFFDGLIQAQNQVGFTGDVTTATGTAASAMIALRKNAAGAARDLARVAAGASFAAAVFDAFEDRLLLTPYPVETKALIVAAMSKFEADAPFDAVTDYGQADRLVKGHAELCTYSGLTRFAQQALLSAKPSNDTPALTSKVTPAQALYADSVGFAFGYKSRLGDRQLAVLHYYINLRPTAFNDANAQTVLKELPAPVGSQLGLSATARDPATVPAAVAAGFFLKQLYTENTDFQTIVQSVMTDYGPAAAPPIAPPVAPAAPAPAAAPTRPAATPNIRFM